MANKLYEESCIQSTANAIRIKNGTNDTMTVAEFATKIKQLPPIKLLHHTDPGYDDAKASEIVAVAQTYLDAIANGRLTIKYKAGYSVLSGSEQKFKDDDGTYIIQCSAFAGLILRGIPYEESPYFDGDGTKVTARTDLYSWANPDYEKAGVADANELALYAYQNGQILNSNSTAAIKKGDLLFYQYFDNAYFGSIWHVAIALEDGGSKCVHALYGQSSAIWTFDINAIPSKYTLGKLLYIARPYKSGSAVATETTLKITQQPQDQSGAVGDTATFVVKAEGDGLTYEWQYSTNGTNWYKSGFDGWDTDTQPVQINTFRNGQVYRCVVTDAHGNTVTSDIATLLCVGGYINQVPISTDLDGSIFNSKGYLEEKRLNSAGNVVDLEYTGQGCNPVVTGFIPVKNNDTFYFKNAYLLKANEYALRIMTYDDNKKIVASELNNLTGNALVTGSYSSRINFELEEVGMDTLAVTKLKAPENWETGGIPAYIRFTLQRPSADAVPIITINEEID